MEAKKRALEEEKRRREQLEKRLEEETSQRQKLIEKEVKIREKQRAQVRRWHEMVFKCKTSPWYTEGTKCISANGKQNHFKLNRWI